MAATASSPSPAPSELAVSRQTPMRSLPAASIIARRVAAGKRSWFSMPRVSPSSSGAPSRRIAVTSSGDGMKVRVIDHEPDERRAERRAMAA